MKKRLKGLLSIFVAMMVMFSTVVSSLGAISDTEYDNYGRGSYYYKVYYNKDQSIDSIIENNGSFDINDISEDYWSYVDGAYEPGVKDYYKVSESTPSGYVLAGFKLWEAKAGGLVTGESASKQVGADYLLNLIDFKAYGLCENNILQYPVLEAIYQPIKVTIPVYDVDGITKLRDDIVCTVEDYGDSDDALTVSEERVGWWLEYNYQGYWGRTDVKAFIRSMEEVWNRIESHLNDDITGIKLTAADKLPYFIYTNTQEPIAVGDYNNRKLSESDIKYLEMSIPVNDQVEVDSRPEYYAADWRVWKVNDSGKYMSTTGYEQSAATGFQLSEWLELVYDNDIYYNDGYSSIPTLEVFYTPVDYSIDVYNKDGSTSGKTFAVNIEDYQEAEFPSDVEADGWKLVYREDEYTIEAPSDVWTKCISVIGEKFDVSQAKLCAVCNIHTSSDTWQRDENNHWKICSVCGEKYDEHSHISDGGKVTTEATADTDGIKTYTCTECGFVIGTENIPKTGTDDDNGPADTENTDWNTIKNNISSAEEGSQINVVMDDTGELPGEVLDTIMGKDINLVIDMGNGIVWTINGKDVTDPKTVNLGVTLGENIVPVEVLNKVTGQRKTIQISLAHEGEFGFKAELSVALGEENDGYWAYLYYYNPDTVEMEFIDDSQVVEGKAKLTFTHASSYAVVINEKPYSDKVDDSINSTDDLKNDSEAGADSTPATGDSIAVTLIIAVMAAALALYLFEADRKKAYR